jgi:hypothetical protein
VQIILKLQNKQMKKIYILIAVFGLSLSLTAQKTTKKPADKIKTAKSKTTVTQKPAFPSTDATTTVAVKDVHSAATPATPAIAATPAVDMAKPIGEDNLDLKEVSHDFGKIQQGKPVTYDFTFVNKGKTELKLDNVQAGCGCTTPTWKPGPYKPNEAAAINVGYNAAGVGAFTKQVTITYNGGLTKVLTITGEVLAAPATPAPENKGVQLLKGN